MHLKVQHCMVSYTAMETLVYISIVNVLLQHEHRGGNRDMVCHSLLCLISYTLFCDVMKNGV